MDKETAFKYLQLKPEDFKGLCDVKINEYGTGVFVIELHNAVRMVNKILKERLEKLYESACDEPI